MNDELCICCRSPNYRMLKIFNLWIMIFSVFPKIITLLPFYAHFFLLMQNTLVPLGSKLNLLRCVRKLFYANYHKRWKYLKEKLDFLVSQLRPFKRLTALSLYFLGYSFYVNFWDLTKIMRSTCFDSKSLITFS